MGPLTPVEALLRFRIVSNNADNWHSGDRGGREGPLGDRNGDGENDVADGAGKGATAGGLLGAGAGVLAGLGMLAIAGLGPVSPPAGWRRPLSAPLSAPRRAGPRADCSAR